MNLRSEVGQVAWVGRRYASARRLRLQRHVIRTMDLPDLPRRRRVGGEVWAVGVVRDEADVVVLVLKHLLDQGVDHVLIADNGSQDGTRELLGDLEAVDPRVHVADDALMAHHQSEKVTWLANRAWRSGADWILPFDGDEFWFAHGQSVAERLRASTKGIVHAHFHHMVPTGAAGREHPESWEFLLDSTPGSPGKVAARSHPLLEIHPGNHAASRVGGEEVGLYIAHAIYRGPAQVARKVRQGQRALVDAGDVPAVAHWTLGSQLDDAAVDAVWARMVAGEPEPLIGWAAAGPMVKVRPVSWSTWDPQGQLPQYA